MTNTELTPLNLVPSVVAMLAHMSTHDLPSAVKMRFELQLYYRRPECLSVTGRQTLLTHNSAGERTTVEIDFDTGQLRTDFLFLFDHEQALTLALRAAREPAIRRDIRRSLARVNRRFRSVREAEGRVPDIFRLYAMLLPYPLQHRDDRERALVAALFYGLALSAGRWPHPLIRDLYGIPAQSKTLDRWFQDARRYGFLLPPNASRDRPRTDREQSNDYWAYLRQLRH